MLIAARRRELAFTLCLRAEQCPFTILAFFSGTGVVSSVTYEMSYLPFLFPSFHDTPAADGPSSSSSTSDTLRPRGRRVFNKRGEEVTQQVRGSSLHHMITELTIVASLPGLEFDGNRRRTPRGSRPTGNRTDKNEPAALDIVYRHGFSHG